MFHLDLMPITNAQDNATVNGLKIIDLDEPYRYKSGGVTLVGYIYKDKSDVKVADKVSFFVCNTSSQITVNYKDLRHVEWKCPNFPLFSCLRTV
jgi:hypothetical protein